MVVKGKQITVPEILINSRGILSGLAPILSYIHYPKRFVLEEVQAGQVMVSIPHILQCYAFLC